MRSSPWDPAPLDRLTPRHRQVVRLVGGRRLSYKKVARELELSVHTVKDYARDIRARSGLKELRPRDAISVLYMEHMEELEEEAA